jgi:hypothetical protein
MNLPINRHPARGLSLPGLLLVSWLLLLAPVAAQNRTANEGGDLAFGGAGSEPGKFLQLRDMTFDSAGNLYTLDGVKLDAKTRTHIGNLRVQKFSSSGKLLAAVDLRDEATGQALGAANDPQRLAVDARGHVFVTQPAAGQVQEFGPDGKWVRTFPVPRALAITTWRKGDEERIAVVPSRREVVKGKGWTWLEGDKVVLLARGGGIEKTIALQTEMPLENVQDIATDRENRFYVQAEPNAIYQFAPDGKLLRIFGGNPTTRNEDGSEVRHTVALDSKGNLYTMTWGNPGRVSRFDADGKTVTQRGGQFQFADSWSAHAEYTILAVAPDDRLWVGVTRVADPKGVHYARQRDVPAIVRTKGDFFSQPAGAARVTPVRMLGFRAEVKCGLPYNLSYEPGKPVPMEYIVAAANRSVDSITVEWRVFDAFKGEVGKGQFPLALRNGQEARSSFTFTPPRFGAYFVHAQARAAQDGMGAVGEHVGVSPRWQNMPVLQEGESQLSWEDAPRQMWTGLPNMRLHPAKSLDKLYENLKVAEKYGATVIVQLNDNLKHVTPEATRALMERFKGRIRYLEVCNEPNFSGGIDAYFQVHKQVYAIVKAIDPKVQVMGPATVNMDLKWLERLYELGFKDVCDIISIHDYEGHESISPEHWKWKFAEMRKIMARHGDETKPIWQTERAIAGVRARAFMGMVQAIRTTLHRDLLETLGVPSAHNFHYYLDQGGYSSVPSYLWSKNGPHPGALALRTRHALTSALSRPYAGPLDFGRNGNELLLGVRYGGKDGETVSLRNLGTRDWALDFQVRGTQTLDVVDAWGNAQPVPVRAGRARLVLGQLPTYVRLPHGAELIAPRLDFGRNLAPLARFAYSSPFKGELAWLNNGILETYHAGSPNGDTNGQRIWQGELPDDLPANPQTLELSFDRPQKIGRVVLRGVRPDNAFCALLRYDLQYEDGGQWKTIERLERPMPRSEEARTADATGTAWVDDTNFFLHEFPPVTTAQLRLVVRDTTHGLLPDDRLTVKIPRKLMLREVEVYGPDARTSSER